MKHEETLIKFASNIHDWELENILKKIPKQDYYSLEEISNAENTFPEKMQIFNCFKAISLAEISFVIVGQDPYPKKGMATGLAFDWEMKDNSKRPLSLRKLEEAFGIEDKQTLKKYAESNKILLLNFALTVSADVPGSHLKEWALFQKVLINKILEQSNVKFLCFGKKVEKLILKELGIENRSNEIKERFFFAPHPAAFCMKNRVAVILGKAKEAGMPQLD